MRTIISTLVDEQRLLHCVCEVEENATCRVRRGVLAVRACNTLNRRRRRERDDAQKWNETTETHFEGCRSREALEKDLAGCLVVLQSSCCLLYPWEEKYFRLMIIENDYKISLRHSCRARQSWHTAERSSAGESVLLESIDHDCFIRQSASLTVVSTNRLQ